MTGRTTIEWTWMPGFEGDVWNPTTGCTRVSAGCDNCYAFSLHDQRYLVNREAAKKLGIGHHNGYSGIEAAADAREDDAKLPFPKQYDLPFSHVQLLPDRLDDDVRLPAASVPHPHEAPGADALVGHEVPRGSSARRQHLARHERRGPGIGRRAHPAPARDAGGGAVPVVRAAARAGIHPAVALSQSHRPCCHRWGAGLTHRLGNRRV